MPTPFEQELLAMAARQRQASSPRPTAPLPDLPAGLFDSHEVPAAIQRAAQTAPPQVATTPSHAEDAAAWATLEAAHNSYIEEQFEGSSLMGPRNEVPRPPSTVEAALAGQASVTDLQALWGVPAEFRASHDQTVAYEDFELDRDLPGSGAPNPAVRFQMGREDPPARPFSRQMVQTGGEVVSQRTANGQFRAVERPRTPRPQSAQPAGRQAGPRPAGAPNATARAMTAMADIQAPVGAPVGPSSAPVPSRYDRLRQPSSFDIDD